MYTMGVRVPAVVGGFPDTPACADRRYGMPRTRSVLPSPLNCTSSRGGSSPSNTVSGAIQYAPAAVARERRLRRFAGLSFHAFA